MSPRSLSLYKYQFVFHYWHPWCVYVPRGYCLYMWPEPLVCDSMCLWHMNKTCRNLQHYTHTYTHTRFFSLPRYRLCVNWAMEMRVCVCVCVCVFVCPTFRLTLCVCVCSLVLNQYVSLEDNYAVSLTVVIFIQYLWIYTEETERPLWQISVNI